MTIYVGILRLLAKKPGKKKKTKTKTSAYVNNSVQDLMNMRHFSDSMARI
jgi:hypothetical protein